MKCKTKAEYKRRRHLRLRRRVAGTAERPRMAVYRSRKHMVVQFIDDERAVTLASASTMGKESPVKADHATVEVAAQLGKAAAETARSKGIEEVVFDRGGYAYKGRVRALADAAREAGLKF